MNQASTIFNSLSPDVQKEMIDFVKDKIPTVPESVRFDVPGKKIEAYVEGFVNAKEAAEFYGVHEKTIYEMRSRGEIPAYKVSGQYRFRLSELENAVRREKL